MIIQLNPELEKMFDEVFKKPELAGKPVGQMNILVADQPKERTYIKKSESEKRQSV